jgi:hypothetical protein
MTKPKSDKAEAKLVQFLAGADALSSTLWALGENIDTYAADCSGSNDHATALAAAKKGCEKARKELDAIKLSLLAAHGAAQIEPPAEQLHLAKDGKDGAA